MVCNLCLVPPDVVYSMLILIMTHLCPCSIAMTIVIALTTWKRSQQLALVVVHVSNMPMWQWPCEQITYMVMDMSPVPPQHIPSKSSNQIHMQVCI